MSQSFLLFTYTLLSSFVIFVNGDPNDKLMLYPPIGCMKFKEAPLCSYGHCVDINNFTLPGKPNDPSSKCLCEPGWTGAGDLIDMNGHDCDINLLYLKIFWSINAGLSIIFLLVIIIKLIKSCIHFRHLLEKTSTTKPQQPQQQQQQQNTSNQQKPPHYSPEHSITTTASTLSDSHRGLVAHRPQTPVTKTSTPDFTIPHPLTPSLKRPHTPDFSKGSQNPPPATNHQLSSDLRSWCYELLSWEVIQISLLALPIAVGLLVVGLGRAHGKGDENLIGRCWWITFFHSIVLTTASGGQKRTTLQFMNIRKKVVKFTSHNAARAKKMIRRTRRCLRFMYFADILIFIIENLIPAYPYYANILVILLLGLLGFVTWIQAIAIIHAARQLEKILLEGLERLHGASKTEREKTLRNIIRLKMAYRRSLFAAPMMIASTLWPFVRIKASWFLPVHAPPLILSHFLVVYNCQYPSTFQDKTLMKDSSTDSKDGGASGPIVSYNSSIHRKASSPHLAEVELKPLGVLPESEESSRKSSPSSTPYVTSRSLDSSLRIQVPHHQLGSLPESEESSRRSSLSSTPHLSSRNIDPIRVPYLASTPSLRPNETSSANSSMILVTPAGGTEAERLNLTGLAEEGGQGDGGTAGLGGTVELGGGGGGGDGRVRYAPLTSAESKEELHLFSRIHNHPGSRPESRNSPGTDEDIPDLEDTQPSKHIFNPFYKAVGINDDVPPRVEGTN